MSTQQAWRDAKIAKAKTKEGGKTIAENFGTLWPIKLGRVDSGVAAPAGRLLAANASPKEVQVCRNHVNKSTSNTSSRHEFLCVERGSQAAAGGLADRGLGV